MFGIMLWIVLYLINQINMYLLGYRYRNRSDEGLMLETSAFFTLNGG